MTTADYKRAYQQGYSDAMRDSILVDELARSMSDETYCVSRDRSTATIMQDILDLPSLTPQQKIGLWQEICKKFEECTEKCPLYRLCYYKAESEKYGED